MQEADSTNTFLKGMKNCDDDTIVVAVADYQTAGRGQGAHTWESEPGKNLLFSMLMTPTWVPVRQQFLLSEAGALAVTYALDRDCHRLQGHQALHLRYRSQHQSD